MNTVRRVFCAAALIAAVAGMACTSTRSGSTVGGSTGGTTSDTGATYGGSSGYGAGGHKMYNYTGHMRGHGMRTYTSSTRGYGTGGTEGIVPEEGRAKPPERSGPYNEGPGGTVVSPGTTEGAPVVVPEQGTGGATGGGAMKYGRYTTSTIPMPR